MARLIDRLLSRAGYAEWMWSGAELVTAQPYPGPGRRTAERGLPGFAGQVRDAYQSSGPVFACILARASLFSEAKFVFQRLTDKSLYGTEDLRILEYPWPNGTTGELLWRLEQDVSMAGNAYVRAVDHELVRMRPDLVTIVSEELTDSMGRVYRRPVGYAEDRKPLGYTEAEPQFYDVSEVAHWSPVPDPLAEWRGMSWLTPVMREINADRGLTEYKIAHVANGAMPGIVLKYSQKLSEPAVETLKKRFRSMFGGPSNAGKVLVLDEGADATVAGSTLEQLQFTAVQNASAERIASAAGVPPTVAGLGDPTTIASGYEANMRRFADLTMRPNWRSVCACLQHLVPNMPPRGVRLWFDVNDVAALRQGEMERAQSGLVKGQSIAALIVAGFTRESVVSAVNSGDLSQLAESPSAPPPGVQGRETATSRETVGGTPGPGAVAGQSARPPQAGLHQAQPGALAAPLPKLMQQTPAVSPPVRNGRGG